MSTTTAKRAPVKKRKTSVKTAHRAPRKPHSNRAASGRAAPAPDPTPLDDETAAMQTEKHGMIEEAMEPPPRGGEDIER
ncbi:MAG: hypothetical protein ABIU95_03540 [Burkholderiales bacterium]